MSRPQRKRRITEEPGPPPSQKTVTSSFGTANGDLSQALGHNFDGNTRTGLAIPGINPVEDGDFTVAEEKSELNKLGCETSESALLYLAADDSKDADWLLPRMAKKLRGKTDGPTTRAPYGRGPDVMSKSERTERRYSKAWKGQKRLDTFFVTRPTIPHKRSPPESSISDDDSESDTGMQTEPEVAASKNNPIAPAAGALTHAGSDP